MLQQCADPVPGFAVVCMQNGRGANQGEVTFRFIGSGTCRAPMTMEKDGDRVGQQSRQLKLIIKSVQYCRQGQVGLLRRMQPDSGRFGKFEKSPDLPAPQLVTQRRTDFRGIGCFDEMTSRCIVLAGTG